MDEVRRHGSRHDEMSRLPLMPLAQTPAPPPGLAPRPGLTYFEVTLAGPCGQGIQDTREFGVYVPDGVPNAALELAVLVPS